MRATFAFLFQTLCALVSFRISSAGIVGSKSVETYEGPSLIGVPVIYDDLDLRKTLENNEQQLIIWKIEDGKSVIQIDLTYETFKSDASYIILKGKPEEKQDYWNIFYWLGRESSDGNAGDAASLTVRLDARIHPRINIRREYQGGESKPFRTTFGVREEDTGKKEAVKERQIPRKTTDDTRLEEAEEKLRTSKLDEGGSVSEAVSKETDTENLLLVIRVYKESNQDEIREEIVDYNKRTPLSTLKPQDCYVIDTYEDIGLVVWMGAKSELTTRQKCAKKAELYLREENFDPATPIIFVGEEAVIFPFEAPLLGDSIQFLKISQIPTEWKRVAKVEKLILFPLKSGAVKEVNAVECTEFGPREIGDSSSKYLFLDRSFVIYEVPANKAVVLSDNPTITSISIESIDTDRLVLKAPNVKPFVIQISRIATPDTPKLQVTNYYMQFEALDCGDGVAEWLSRYFKKGEGITHRLGYFDANFTERSDMIASTLDQKHFSTYYKHWRKNDSGAFSHLTSYHLLSSPSIDDLNTKVKPEDRMTYLNFRPNIVINDCEKYAEDNWTWLKIGEKVVLRTVKPCTRCPTILVDPRTGSKNKDEPMRTLKGYRTIKQLYPGIRVQMGLTALGLQLGLYEIGEIHVNDDVYVGV